MEHAQWFPVISSRYIMEFYCCALLSYLRSSTSDTKNPIEEEQNIAKSAKRVMLTSATTTVRGSNTAHNVFKQNVAKWRRDHVMVMMSDDGGSREYYINWHTENLPPKDLHL